jgi:hypothetical protein
MSQVAVAKPDETLDPAPRLELSRAQMNVVFVTIGGVFTDNLSWRWVFYINVPIAVIVIALAVRYYRSGVQPFRHPLAGDLDLDYDALEIPADPGLTIVAYSAAPGSPSAQAMRLLIPLSGEANRGNHPQAANRQGSGRVVHRRRVHRRHRPRRGALTRPGQRGQVHALGPHRVALARRRADLVRH